MPPESREIQSDSVRLTVMPLPERGRPDSFTGAVGQFRVRATVEPIRAEVGEAVALVVEVIGRGNIKALPAPLLPEFESVEVFPPTEDAEPQIGSDAVTGTKEFSWVLVPRKPGSIEIPAIRYAYFDPASARYAEASTAPMRLEVEGETPPVPGQIALRPIKPSPSSDALGFVRSPWFLGAQLVPLILVLGAWRGSRRAEPSDARRRTARASAVLSPLHDAVGGEPRAFSHQLASAIRTHLAELYDQPELRHGPPAALQRAAESAGTARATAAALADLLGALDRARFAKDEAAPDPGATLKRAEQLLDAVHSARSRGTAARTASLVLLGLGMSAAASGASHVQNPGMTSITAVSAQTDSFHRGVQLMLRSRFTAAASEFEQYLTANTQDANAWYNAGNALFFAAQPGQAVRAWMRAVQVMPRHAEARSNLAIVAPAALPLLPPGFSLRSTEAGILLAALWWVLAAHAAWLIRKRRRPGLASVILVFVMATVLLGGLASRRASEVAVTTSRAPVHSDPVLKAEPVEELEAATPVQVRGRRPGWLRIRTPDGREGWIEASNLAEV
jgi:hypothetical protein